MAPNKTTKNKSFNIVLIGGPILMKLGIVGYDVNFIVHFGSEKTLSLILK